MGTREKFETQARKMYLRGEIPCLWRHHYVCADGEPFSAVAVREEGAWAVLNAERPGMLADFTHMTDEDGCRHTMGTCQECA